MEGPKPERKKDLSSTIRAGLLAASSLIAPYEHGPARAAEIPKEATWVQGVAELRRSVDQEPVEYAAKFVTFRNGTSEWLPSVAGTTISVATDPKTEREQLREMEERGRVAAVCDIHTHQIQGSREGRGVPGLAGVTLAPPGSTDIDLIDVRHRILSGDDLGANTGGRNVFQAVFDTRGIWYYRRATEADVKRIDPDRENMFVTRSEALQKLWRARDTVSEWLGSLPDETIQNAFTTVPESTSYTFSDLGRKDAENIILQNIFDEKRNRRMPELLTNITPAGKLNMSAEIRSIIDTVHQDNEAGKREADLETTINTFTVESASGTFDFDAEYTKLRKAYLRWTTSALIRFVPYEKLGDEPTCAGPDYVPPKK